MCTSLFSLASQRSIFCRVLAYSSHLFLLKTKLTTGNNLFFLRWLMRWVQTFWSSWKPRDGGPKPPPRPRTAPAGGPVGAPLMPPPRFECDLPAPMLVRGAPRPVGRARVGTPPLPPVRCTGGRPAASRSLSCFLRVDSPAALYLKRRQPDIIPGAFVTHPSPKNCDFELTILCNSLPAHR